MMQTRQAVLPDVEQIHAIIQPYADEGTLLPRSIAELSENVRDFIVAGENGHVVGCGALHLYGMHLAEIRSIAVLPERKGTGAGRALVAALIEESRRHSVTCLCLFTRTPGFFAHLGFEISSRQDLPDKIYKDCIHCPKLTCCDEIAMVMGQLPPNSNGFRDPQIAIPLVQLK
ncbi:MAG TPA: N-acetyltransferase [Candidatus Acidoferrales bacterium]|jgi:amino-acid N-acetyltransferase|nr:N-acetyltransferase [Candidatus Acidoferrales bacterium]